MKKIYYYNLFLIVPILSTTISTYHIISLFLLGNNFLISLLLAITFEIGSIAAFLLPSIYRGVNKNLLYFVFFILFFMQVIGNIFYSYDYIFQKLKIEPNWLDSFISFINNILIIPNNSKAIFYLSILIGVFIPVISLFFLKSWIEYLQLNKNEDNNNNNDDFKSNENLEKIETSKNLEKTETSKNLENDTLIKNKNINHTESEHKNTKENDNEILSKDIYSMYNNIDNLKRNIIIDNDNDNAIINNMI